MLADHFFTLLVVFILLGFALFIKRVILDVVGIAYVAVLAYMAINGGWELLFLPILTGFVIIFTVMLFAHAVKGDLV